MHLFSILLTERNNCGSLQRLASFKVLPIMVIGKVLFASVQAICFLYSFYSSHKQVEILLSQTTIGLTVLCVSLTFVDGASKKFKKYPTWEKGLHD